MSFGKPVVGSLTWHNAYIIFPLLNCADTSSRPPSNKNITADKYPVAY